MDDKANRIRALNDRLRQYHIGGHIVMTAGVQALEPEALTGLTDAIADFDQFSTNTNDLRREHDCATIEFEGQTFIWKIDYYDKSLQYGSSDPSDPAVTTRVMTIELLGAVRGY
jgi:hypothetical protein